jgi:hypothetical protein
MVASLSGAMMQYAQDYYSTVSDLFRTAIRAWAAVWISWSLVRLGMNSPPDTKEAVEQLLFFSIGDFALEFPSMLWQLVDIITSSGLWAASKAFGITSDGQSANSLSDIVCYAETGMQGALWDTIMSSWNDMTVFSQIGTVLFTIVFFLLSWFLVAKAIKAIALPMARVFVVMILMPAVVFLTTIGAYRSIAINATKTLIISAMELVVASSVVGVMISMVIKTANSVGVPATSNGVSGSASTWLGSPSYFSIITMLVLFYFIFDELCGVPASILGMISGRTTLPSVLSGLRTIGDTFSGNKG